METLSENAVLLHFLCGQIGKLRTFNVYAKLRACLNFPIK